MCAHRYTNTSFSRPLVPNNSEFLLPSLCRAPEWQPRGWYQWQCRFWWIILISRKEFPEWMQALGNWEWVLWAIRYVVDDKKNPHLLLVTEKEIYFSPTKKVKGLDRYQLPWQHSSTTAQFILSLWKTWGKKENNTKLLSVFLLNILKWHFMAWAWNNFFWEERTGEPEREIKGECKAWRTPGTCLRGASCLLMCSVPMKLRGKEKKVINIYWVPTTCLVWCLIMNSLQPPRTLCLKEKDN